MEVVESVDFRLADAVGDLLARHTAAAGFPGLSEGRVRALDHATRTGGAGGVVVGAAARYPGQSPLVGWAQIDADDDVRLPTMEVVALSVAGGPSAVDALLDSALGAFAAGGGGPLRWWVGHATDADDARAATRGFGVERDLFQMRCPLPLPIRPGMHAPVPVATRAFVTGRDEAAWLVQNNRAFAEHPEQGHWDLATLEEREAEPWFDPDGFRVLEVDGRIAGSCWTKVHRTADPPLGEIYVVGVDPDFHGRGWGRALTEDGFRWLASSGMDHGMLYVDATNTAAVALYRSLGMTTHHVDRAYVAPSVVPQLD